MTWEIVLGLIALLGAGVTIGGMIFKLSKTLAILEATINMLVEILKEFKSDSNEVHHELSSRVDKCEKKCADHETRIAILERMKNITK